MATRSHPLTSPPTYDGLGPAAYVIPVPLIVLARCDPRQLMVWVALRWLGEVFPEAEQHGGPSYHLLSRLCKIDRRGLGAIFAHLRAQQLVQDVGLSRVARARAARPHYVIDADHVDALTRRHFAAILAGWQLPASRLPRQVPAEQLALFTSLTGASGISSNTTTGPSGITAHDATGASGITAHDSTGTSGITSTAERFAVSVQGSAPYRTIFVPLVVFDRCDPSELATWMAQCWLLTVQADTPGEIGARQVAAVGTVGRGKLAAYYARLLSKRLVIHVGTGHAPHTYMVSHHRLLLLNAQEAATILARWQVQDRPLQPTQPQQLLLSPSTGASGITGRDTTGASGISAPLIPQSHPESTGASGITSAAATGASGITSAAATGAFGITSAAATGTSGITPAMVDPALKRTKKKKGGDHDSLVTVTVPDGHPPLTTHPLALWQQLDPHMTAADRERLRRSAAEHDQPYGAYPGGYGLYWLGRAIEATLTKTDQPPTLRYVRGVLRSWRTRTTDTVSAYGSDAPTYAQRDRHVQPAPASTPSPLPMHLAELWQHILHEMAQRLDRTAFATWLQDSVLVALDDGTAVVAVPTVFAQEHVAAVHAAELAAVLTAALQRPLAVEVVIGDTTRDAAGYMSMERHTNQRKEHLAKAK